MKYTLMYQFSNPKKDHEKIAYLMMGINRLFDEIGLDKNATFRLLNSYRHTIKVTRKEKKRK